MEYILVRDGGSEGYGPPLLSVYKSDVSLVLRVLALSHDGSLGVYEVSGLRDEYSPAPKRITFDTLPLS